MNSNTQDLEKECLQTLLDDFDVPRSHNSEKLSIGGRCEYLRAAVSKLQSDCDIMRQDAAQFRTLWDEAVAAHFHTSQNLSALQEEHQHALEQTQSASAILAKLLPQQTSYAAV